LPPSRSIVPRAGAIGWRVLLVGRAGWRSWVISLVAAFAAYQCASQGLVLFGARWQLPLLVGLVTGLVSLVAWQAAASALFVQLASMLIWPPLLAHAEKPGASGWLLAIVVAPLAAGGLCALRRLSADRGGERRLNRVAAIAIVALTVANFWYPLVVGGWPATGYGLLPAAQVRAPAAPGTYGNDEGLYRRIFALQHQGEGFYAAFRDAWSGIAQHPAPPNSPTGFRLPTYFWLWRQLPDDPFTVVELFLVFASVGIVAAAFVGGELVGSRLAPLSALAVAAYAIDVGFSMYALFVDLPAMSIVLVGVALFAYAARTRRLGVLWAAAGVCALAALTREVLVYVLVFAALSALFEPAGERLRRAVPWLAGLAAFAVGYVAHALAVAPFLGAGSTSVTYLNGGPAYLADAFSRFSGSFGAGEAALVVFIALGVVGAIGCRRRAGSAFGAFAIASVTLPFAAMLVIGNPGHDAAGAVANYWGLLVVPLALAFWPASAALLVGTRAPARS
jgi:hypothetical protein